MAKPQAAIMRLLCKEVGVGLLPALLSRRIGRLLVEEFVPPQAKVITSRLRDVFRVAPFAVAIASLKAVCKGMPTSKRFGGGALACRFGCRAVTTLATTCVAL